MGKETADFVLSYVQSCTTVLIKFYEIRLQFEQ